MLNLLSVNCRGGLNGSKLYELFDYLTFRHCHIAFIQETHIYRQSSRNFINRKFNCKTYHSLGTHNSLGVMIVVFNNFEHTFVKFDSDSIGRLVFVDLKISDSVYRFCNFYLPNIVPDRKSLIDELPEFIHTKNPMIIAGDFNFVENLHLDKRGGSKHFGNGGVANFNKVKSLFDLDDPFRVQNPTGVSFTITKGEVSNRLDRFYVSKNILDTFSGYKTDALTFSDHCSVHFQFNVTGHVPLSFGKGYWKCNKQHFDHVKEDFEFEYMSLKQNSSDPCTFWEKAKLLYKECETQFGKNATKSFRNELSQLQDLLNEFVLAKTNGSISL